MINEGSSLALNHLKYSLSGQVILCIENKLLILKNSNPLQNAHNHV